MLLILFGASVAVQALRGGSDPRLGTVRERPIVTPGLVMVIAVLTILVSRGNERRSGVEAVDGSSLRLFALMSRDDHISHSNPFQGGEITSIMGRSRLDLRQATIPPGGEAALHVFTMWGETEILVPEGWIVDVDAAPVMGGVKDRRSSARPPPQQTGPEAGPAGDRVEAETTPSQSAPPAPGSPRLVLRGVVLMGSIVIGS